MTTRGRGRLRRRVRGKSDLPKQYSFDQVFELRATVIDRGDYWELRTTRAEPASAAPKSRDTLRKLHATVCHALD